MEFDEVIKKRRSIRKYSNKPVPRDIIEQIFKNVLLSPSAENSQGWEFIVIDDKKIKDKLNNAAFSGIFQMPWTKTAPVLVVMLSKKKILANILGDKITKINYQCLDAGIAGEHFVLSAENLGLSTCWIGWFNKKKVRKALNIPSSYEIYALFTLGYKDKDYEPREQKRKPLEKLFKYNGLK